MSILFEDETPEEKQTGRTIDGLRSEVKRLSDINLDYISYRKWALAEISSLTKRLEAAETEAWHKAHYGADQEAVASYKRIAEAAETKLKELEARWEIECPPPKEER